jgi:hypothetical protein
MLFFKSSPFQGEDLGGVQRVAPQILSATPHNLPLVLIQEGIDECKLRHGQEIYRDVA